MNNEIKKELYKQKPIAYLFGVGKAAESVVKGFQEKVNLWEERFEKEGTHYYKTTLKVEGFDVSVFFEIPQEEVFDKEGNRILKGEEPAQLLIRWLL